MAEAIGYLNVMNGEVLVVVRHNAQTPESVLAFNCHNEVGLVPYLDLILRGDIEIMSPERVDADYDETAYDAAVAHHHHYRGEGRGGVPTASSQEWARAASQASTEDESYVQISEVSARKRPKSIVST